jgi:hypothetical protein
MTDRGRTHFLSARVGPSPSIEDVSGVMRALPLALAFSVALWAIAAVVLLDVLR